LLIKPQLSNIQARESQRARASTLSYTTTILCIFLEQIKMLSKKIDSSQMFL
jgi:hypothetical protein